MSGSSNSPTSSDTLTSPASMFAPWSTVCLLPLGGGLQTATPEKMASPGRAGTFASHGTKSESRAATCVRMKIKGGGPRPKWDGTSTRPRSEPRVSTLVIAPTSRRSGSFSAPGPSRAKGSQPLASRLPKPVAMLMDAKVGPESPPGTLEFFLDPTLDPAFETAADPALEPALDPTLEPALDAAFEPATEPRFLSPDADAGG
mmetsp:Transcript_26567/g.50084  ORF Transcript_26567/g.50084 Transcript_26567/m.50084 type:complete len:202 (-) Transcript_26567:152-757(-)